MRQVIQSARSGRLKLRDVPDPKVRPGALLVRTRASLISAGTERMVVEFARKNIAAKARARPDLVKKVVEKAKRDGLGATFRAVMARLDEPLPLGYSAAGEVVAVGQGLEGRFRVGERVAIAGAGVANHAELNVVPENLATKIPEGVADEQAAFATVGAIALHAVRNTNASLGDWVAVIGVGLVGQLAARLLTLGGARVLALDYDPARLELAATQGAEAAFDLSKTGLAETVAALTGGLGVDSVLIAAATEESEPLEKAAEIARDRAKVVMVGMTGTAFPYADYMKKELSIVVSRSYGPGRYDRDFENRGAKYPEGWVRWTETANMAEVLRLLSPGKGLDAAALITHRFDFKDAEAAYDLVTGGAQPHLGVVLRYPDPGNVVRPRFKPTASASKPGTVRLGVIGAGAFAKSVLLPELKRIPEVTLATLTTVRGASAEHSRETFGFARAAADEAAVLDDPEIDAVLIATRHDSHAELTARALAAGKCVLVEKPLALDLAGINKVIQARESSGAFFQVGFNRRFAPLVLKAKAALDKAAGPKVIVLRVNAGAIPADSWIQGADEGGGRVLGEMCHFVDLARFLAGAPIRSVGAEAADGAAAEDVAATIRFADGSLASVVYSARGDAGAGKERFEIFAGGTTVAVDNFKSLAVDAHGRRETASQGAGDKGIAQALRAFVGAVRAGGPAPIDEAELIETSAATVAVMESLRTGGRVDL